MGIFSWLFRKKGNGSDRGKERMGWSEEPDLQEEFLKDDPKEAAKKKSPAPKPKAKVVEESYDVEFDSDFFLGYTEAKQKEEPPKPAAKPKAVKKEVAAQKNDTEPVKAVEDANETAPQPKKDAPVEAKTESPAKKNKPEQQKNAVETKKAATAVKDEAKPKKAPVPKNTKVTEPAEKEIEDDSPEVKEAVAIGESKATANGKFDIRRAKDGRYFFSLYASNHMVIAYSQIYSSTKSVSTGINSVINNATKAPIEDNTLKNPTSLPCPKWEIYKDKADQFRFRLYASNGLCVCHSSHGYSTKSGAKGGIDSIRRFSAEARIDKSYLNKE